MHPAAKKAARLQHPGRGGDVNHIKSGHLPQPAVRHVLGFATAVSQ
jgi:hypothetical protein